MTNLTQRVGTMIGRGSGALRVVGTVSGDINRREATAAAVGLGRGDREPG